MGVPNFDAQFKLTKWEVRDIQPKFDLPQLWEHVEGVPHTLRHFHGLWALGSLMGTTVDVDLPTLYSQNMVRILVAMMSPDTLNKQQDARGSYVDVNVTLKLKGYDLWFRKQTTDFKPDTSYTPFFWKRKEDDLDGRDMSKSKGKGPQGMPQGASSSQDVSMATSMDVDALSGVSTYGGSGSQQRSGALEAAASVWCLEGAAQFDKPHSAYRCDRHFLTGTHSAALDVGRSGAQVGVPLAGPGLSADLFHPREEVALPLLELGQVTAVAQVQS
jgi:hypothetical protein